MLAGLIQERAMMFQAINGRKPTLVIGRMEIPETMVSNTTMSLMVYGLNTIIGDFDYGFCLK